MNDYLFVVIIAFIIIGILIAYLLWHNSHPDKYIPMVKKPGDKTDESDPTMPGL